LIKCWQRPRLRGRPGLLARWPVQGMDREIWRRWWTAAVRHRGVPAGSMTGDVVGACPRSVYQRVTTLKQIMSRGRSPIGGVPDHSPLPAGLAAAISSASDRACAIFPRCRGRHNRAVSPYFRHRSMPIAAFQRPPTSGRSQPGPG